MDLNRMDLERRKRTDPAFSVRAEFPKNTIKLDKFTGFFDKILKTTTFIKSTLLQLVTFISSSKNEIFFRILSK